MKTTRLLPWIIFLSGALMYVIGLWQACPLLSGKGYFFGVLMTGMFVGYVYQWAENLNLNDERFVSVCQMVALITVGLLLVGVWNAPLSPLEKGLYPVAFFMCLLGQVLLMRSTENLSKGQEL
ncbi:MAG: inner membrane protein YiaB [Citrobacter sp.]|uniref:inner membrane protein YiaB n=1 Tax=Citrobacter sp. TaxID=1896336 RepID=UPI002FC8630D